MSMPVPSLPVAGIESPPVAMMTRDARSAPRFESDGPRFGSATGYLLRARTRAVDGEGVRVELEAYRLRGGALLRHAEAILLAKYKGYADVVVPFERAR